MLNKTILIADDDRDFLKLEEAFLVREGYNVIVAQDAYRALHLAVTQSPSLLLLDVNMPAGDGLSVHDRMLRVQASRDIPVIYMTGSQSESVMVRARKMGAFAVMYKPFDCDVLLANVKAAIHESTLQAQTSTIIPGDSQASWWASAAPAASQ